MCTVSLHGNSTQSVNDGVSGEDSADESEESKENICRLPMSADALEVVGPHEPVMVVDTACHINVTSEEWMSAHADLLHEEGLRVQSMPLKQTFKFGEGNPHLSTKRYVIPSGIVGTPVLIRAFTLPQPIPFLGSRACLTSLGFVLNSCTNTAVFLKLDPHKEAQLCLTHNKHLAVKITEWPREGFPRNADDWPERPRDEVTLHAQGNR